MAQPAPPVRRGRRVQLAPVQPAEPVATTYVVNVRDLPFGHHMLTDGVEVPGAADWPRIEAWVSARRVRPVKDGEQYTSYEAFTGMTYEDEQAAAEIERLEAELAEEAAEQESTEPEE